MIGNLDQRITLQAKTLTDDGLGGSTSSWADFASVPHVWAAAKPVRGTEKIEEGGTSATGTWLFEIRYRSDIDETDRIVWRDEVFNIRTVKRTSQRELNLVIEAERGVAT